MKKIISFLLILAGDIVSLVLSFYLAYIIRVDVVQHLFNISNPWFFPLEHFYSMYYLLFVFILIFFYEKLYTRRFEFFEEFVYIARGLIISIILIAVIVYLSRSYEQFTRSLPLIMTGIAMIIVPLVRLIVKWILKRTHLYLKHTAVMGLKDETNEVIPSLRKLETKGYKIENVFHIPASSQSESEDESLSNQFKDIRSIETLVIISKGIEKERLNRLINYWENHVPEIKIVSDSSYLKTIGVETEYVEELLVMQMANKLLSPVSRAWKRVFDLFVSFISCVVLFPFFLIIAILIKLNSPGSVLFIQERYGKDGKKFKILKFRTMYVNGDDKLKEYLKSNPGMQAEWDQYKKLKTYDPRVTGIGKFLRRFSIDEFPQVFNVLIGDMSIVGPRPYLPREKEEIEKSAAIIFRVKSGLTGLWQIKGRNELSFETRLKLDEFYVRNWSFLQDIMIILKTFGVVLRGRGAY